MGRTSPGTREDQRALAQDEIYEHYLSRAISEINELGHELAGRVLGSGHPLADVFLLKHAPGTAELAEGVAFFGRAGQAVLKSVQRLGIDPSLLYGTNCLKSRDAADAEPAPRWLERELAIVQPKIVVAMGDETVSFLNGLDLPLAVPVELEVGRVQRLTPTIEVLVVPAIEESLDDQVSKRAFWDAFRALGEWYEALPPY
jgi:uracil-DNA glycosylase